MYILALTGYTHNLEYPSGDIVNLNQPTWCRFGYLQSARQINLYEVLVGIYCVYLLVTQLVKHISRKYKEKCSNFSINNLETQKHTNSLMRLIRVYPWLLTWIYLNFCFNFPFSLAAMAVGDQLYVLWHNRLQFPLQHDIYVSLLSYAGGGIV